MNASTKEVFIFKNSKLSVIQDYAEEECFFASQKNADLAANSDIHRSTSSAFKNWLKKIMKTEVTTLTADAATY